jgi:glyoxylase-like metal-dependent hydrolase (beta-lactamase superfamily II)
MDGTLVFPALQPPAPGETLPIAPGVHWLRMRLPFALDHINLWLLEDGAGWMIVDAGYATDETKAAWQRIFAESLGGRPVNRILATHYHPDHIGLAGWLTERWDMPLLVTEKEWLHACLASRAEDGGSAAARDAFAGRAGLDQAARESFAARQKSYRRGVPSVPATFHRIGDGDRLVIGGREWRIVVGEGHAPELACLHCAETGVLISADQVLPKISPNISVQAYEPDGDPLGRYLASLDKLRAAIPSETLVLPSHNLPFFGLHARIDELQAHHRARLDEVVAACEVPRSAAELLPVLFRRKLDAHQLGFAIGEALAHLNHLVRLDLLSRAQGNDGVDRFTIRNRGGTA